MLNTLTFVFKYSKLLTKPLLFPRFKWSSLPLLNLCAQNLLNLLNIFMVYSRMSFLSLKIRMFSATSTHIPSLIILTPIFSKHLRVKNALLANRHYRNSFGDNPVMVEFVYTLLVFFSLLLWFLFTNKMYFHFSPFSS